MTIDDTPAPAVPAPAPIDPVALHRLVREVHEAYCHLNASFFRYTLPDTRTIDVDALSEARRRVQSAVGALTRAVPAPLIPPVFVVGGYLPPYMPGPDSLVSLHVDYDYPEDIDTVVELFRDEFTRTLESSIECLTYEGADEADREAASGDEALLESIRSDRADTVGSEIRKGIRRAIRTGTEYGYTINAGNGESWRVFVAPTGDEATDAYPCTCDDYRNSRVTGCRYVPPVLVTVDDARAYAGVWQSPGTPGRVLASFASGVDVPRFALVDDIDATIADVRADHVDESTTVPSARGGWTRSDYLGLFALRSWVMTHDEGMHDVRRTPDPDEHEHTPAE